MDIGYSACPLCQNCFQIKVKSHITMKTLYNKDWTHKLLFLCGQIQANIWAGYNPDKNYSFGKFKYWKFPLHKASRTNCKIVAINPQTKPGEGIEYQGYNNNPRNYYFGYGIIKAPSPPLQLFLACNVLRVNFNEGRILIWHDMEFHLHTLSPTTNTTSHSQNKKFRPKLWICSLISYNVYFFLPFCFWVLIKTFRKCSPFIRLSCLLFFTLCCELLESFCFGQWYRKALQISH